MKLVGDHRLKGVGVNLKLSLAMCSRLAEDGREESGEMSGLGDAANRTS